MITIGLSLYSPSPTGPTALPPAVPSTPFSISTTALGATVGTATDGSGELTVTISDVTDPVAYNGTYDQDVDGNALNPTMLADGPQCLLAVSVQHDGSPAPGEMLVSTPGLWIYDSARGEPVLSYQWSRDGIAIAGATGPSYMVQEADQGATLTLTETATDAGGARSATSPGVTVPAATSTLSVVQLGDGTLEVVTDGSGDLTVTISDVSDPVAYNGVYDQDVDGNALDATMLADGPQCLLAVAVLHGGTPVPGETLVSTPGLWLYDSARAEPVLSYQWSRDGVAIAGATSPSYTVQEADQGATLALTETATDAGGARSATSAGVTVPAAASTLSVMRLGGFQSSGAPTATPSFNIDTSNRAAGEDIYFAYGTDRYATSATVNAQPATKASTNAGNTSAGRLSVFRYTLTAGDIGGSIAVALTLDGGSGHHVFDCWSVSGSTLTDMDEVAHMANPNPLTVSPTVAGTDNAVLVWGVGVGWDVMAYSGATEVETASLPTGSARSMTVGLAEDVAAGAHSITLTPGSSGHLGVVAITLEG